MLPAVSRPRRTSDPESSGGGIATKHARSPSVALLPMSPVSIEHSVSPARPPRSTRRSSGFGFKPLDLELIDKPSSSSLSSPQSPNDPFYLPVCDVTLDAIHNVLLHLRTNLLAQSSRSPLLPTSPQDKFEHNSGTCDTARSTITQTGLKNSTLPTIGRQPVGSSPPPSPGIEALPFLSIKDLRADPSPASESSGSWEGNSSALLACVSPPGEAAAPVTSRRGSSVRSVLAAVGLSDPASDSATVDSITRNLLAFEILQTLLEKYGEEDVKACLNAAIKDKSKDGQPALVKDNAFPAITQARTLLTSGVDVSKLSESPEESAGFPEMALGRPKSRFARRPSTGINGA